MHPAKRQRRAPTLPIPERPTAAERTLGKWANEAAARLQQVGWQQFIRQERGDPHLAPTVGILNHKAGRLLQHLRRRGASVPLHTAPWSHDRLLAAARRGSHQSAVEHTDFVCEEIVEFARQGFWTVLPTEVALTLPHLRLSPLGVVPQRNRRPRLIVDYSYSGVNAETLKLAPPEAMQFGKALQRVLQTLVRANPRYGPVKLGKIDISDGFYRIGLQPSHVPRLGVILPHQGTQSYVALPLALPMGWVESPPYFTAATETACDLTNHMLRQHSGMPPPHRLEALASTPPGEHSRSDPYPVGATTVPPAVVSAVGRSTPRGAPIVAADVYVDDFILMAQTKRHQRRLLRAAMHAIDAIFTPRLPTHPPTRKEPISEKKLSHGDAHWSTRKTILGWDLDTVAGTLALPPHRVERLYALLDAYPRTRNRATETEWHQLLGELRSMSPALPGSRGLFSHLQEALRKRTSDHRIRLTRRVHHCLSDFRALADHLAARPTRFRELVPAATADAAGACDACQRGMGGVWFVGTAAYVWRAPFPLSIQRELVTSHNRAGALSISDLELAGTIAHKAVLAHHHAVAERTLWVAGDNQASLAWATKGSATASSARAYLLRLNALHQRYHRYVALQDYIPGPANVMADDASRRWDLTDVALLTHFNASYPQLTSWTMLPLPAPILSSLTGALCRKRCAPASLRIANTPPPAPGPSGRPSAPPWPSDLISVTSPATPSLSYKSLPISIARAVSPPAVDRSALVRWKTPCVTWRRRLPGWGPRTLA